jgi:ribosomal protein S18 acetylase RimI-like enzyme
VNIRLADEGDPDRLAELHATRISDGFLASLGRGFLERLYRRIVRSPNSFAYVATDAEPDRAVGFAAAAVDVGELYRTFAVRDGLSVSLAVLPFAIRSWRRVLETLRYPSSEGGGDLPKAEILAVAVDEAAAGRGVGQLVVDAALRDLAARGIDEVKVVAGSDNVAALRVYEKCGFTPRARIEVHEGVSSEVLVWNSSSR